MRTNTVKTAWAEGAETLGLWLGAGDPRTAEMLGTLPFDYVNVDLQHGVGDYDSMYAIFQALRTSAAMPFARVPWNEPGIIGRVLDAGAMGVIIPMVNSVDEAAAAVAACRYPPEGRRSYGPLRAAVAHGPNYFDGANEQIAVIPMIETAEALDAIDHILEIDGIDAVYVGPADLSLSLGLAPGNHNDDPLFTDALTRIVESCRQHGVIAGIHCQPDLVALRRSQGFAMITAVSDTTALLDGAARGLAQARDLPRVQG